MSTWFKDIHLNKDGVSLQPLKTGHKQGLLYNVNSEHYDKCYKEWDAKAKAQTYTTD